MLYLDANVKSLSHLQYLWGFEYGKDVTTLSNKISGKCVIFII